jgi:GNAT superfamily N-acetyltransferase
MIYEIVEVEANYPGLLELAKSIDFRKPEFLTEQEDYFVSSHILAAIENDNIFGFIRFVVQQLGIDEERSPIIFGDKILFEAKVLSFGVKPEYRNKGIGRVLQMETMQVAKKLDCYQLRSKSNYEAKANYCLKISMGFGIHPYYKGDAVYFVKAL